jgi:hypothetical protein
MTFRGICDYACEGGLAGSRRAVEDDRRELVCLNGPPQKTAFSDDVLLPDIFRQGSRPHAIGERLRLAAVFCTEEIHGRKYTHVVENFIVSVYTSVHQSKESGVAHT